MAKPNDDGGKTRTGADGDDEKGNNPVFQLTQDQFDALIERVTNMIGKNGDAAEPAAKANGTLDWPDGDSFKRTVNGTVVRDITVEKWKGFMTKDLKLRKADIFNLRDKGLHFPKDFAQCDSDEVAAIIKNLKSIGTPLRAQSQKLLLHTCSWFRTLVGINYTIKDAHLCSKMVMNHAVSAKELLESEDSKKGMPKNLLPLTDGADLLNWLERCHLALHLMISRNNKPLAYVVRVKSEVGLNDDGDILPGKCYIEKSGSLRNILVARHTHQDDAFDAVNKLLFTHLETTLKGNSMVSSLKPCRKTLR